MDRWMVHSVLFNAAQICRPSASLRIQGGRRKRPVTGVGNLFNVGFAGQHVNPLPNLVYFYHFWGHPLHPFGLILGHDVDLVLLADHHPELVALHHAPLLVGNLTHQAFDQQCLQLVNLSEKETAQKMVEEVDVMFKLFLPVWPQNNSVPLINGELDNVLCHVHIVLLELLFRRSKVLF